MPFIRLLYIVFFLSASLLVFGQTPIEVTRSKTVEKSNGKKYYLHTIGEGHTLFSIAKCYGIEVSDIVIENPDCLNGLSLGQVLRIPHRVQQEITYPAYYNDHLLHKAAQGETFYSIAKKYGVSVQELQDLNGFTLAIGQIVRINLSSIKNKPSINSFNKDSIPEELTDVEKIVLLNDDGKLFHLVKHGNTLFGISKLYGVGADEIIDLNPKVKKGIKPGQLLLIPFENYSISIESQDTLGAYISNLEGDTTQKIKGSYTIALLLPFSLNNNEDVENTMFDDNGVLDAKAVVAFDFYAGVQVALDSLEKMGVRATVYTYDTDRNTNKVQQILEKPEFKTMDLIIGPLYSSYFKLVADFAKEHKIGIVAPMSKSTAILNYNTKASKFISSNSSKIRVMANYINNTYKGTNVLVVSDIDVKARTLSDKFYKQLYFSDSTDTTRMLQQVDYKSAYSINSKLSKDTLNVIFFPTTNAGSVSKLLNDLSLRKERILLIGSEKWQSFNLQPDYLAKMNVHLLGTSKIDYESPVVKHFISAYRNKFNSEPSTFSFTGYDVAMSHIFWLHKKGVNFYNKLDKRSYMGLQNNIIYRRSVKINGFENQSSIVLKYQDFEYKKVK